MQLPDFLSEKGNSLVYNGDGELLYYIPETYFGHSKNPLSKMVGYYVSTIGCFDWAIMSKNGKISEAHPFKFPTILLCKPSNIEKVKNIEIGKSKRKKDYRILHFANGDEAISDVNLPQIVDNVETLFKLMVITGGKIPDTVPYDHFHEYPPESMKLNSGSFGINMQCFGILASKVCRDPSDLSKCFRHGNMKSMNDYVQISIKQCPKYTSPYVALTSENWDESLMAAMLIDDKDIKYSPMEKIVTM